MKNSLQAVPTAMALAFIDAAIPALQLPNRKGPWTARRVATNADREIGMVSRPAVNAHLSKKTADMLIKQGVL